MATPVRLRDGTWLLDWEAVRSIVVAYYRAGWEYTLKEKEDIDKYVVQQAPETFIAKVFRAPVTVFSPDRKTWIVSIPHEEARRRAALTADTYTRRLRDWTREPGANGAGMRERLALMSVDTLNYARGIEDFRRAVAAENQEGMQDNIAKYRTAESVARGVRSIAVTVQGALLAAYVVPAMAGTTLVSTTLARGSVDAGFSLFVDALTGEVVEAGDRDAKVVRVTGTITIDALKAAATASGKSGTIIRIGDLTAKSGLEALAGVIEGETAETAFRRAMLSVGLGALAERMLQIEPVKRQLQRFAVSVAGDPAANGNWRRDVGAANSGASAAATTAVTAAGKQLVEAGLPNLSSIDFMSRSLNIARVDAAIRRAA